MCWSSDTETEILNFLHYCQNVIQWFWYCGTKATRQVSIYGSYKVLSYRIVLVLPRNLISILFDSIDDRLNFDEHYSMCCAKVVSGWFY